MNFLLQEPGDKRSKLMGFYINALLEADSSERARIEAVEMVRTSRIKTAVTNTPADPPQMFVDEIAEVEDWPEGQSRPLSGFVFYEDPESDWRKEKSASTPL
ncbi:MAG: hypothetical protein B7Z55_17130 [Planctomycetales bacterium 12-60-4]|nr:MAG: hypothetical protein B7Z55_17130 [Planctomycetales bacterium 12-60-4]